MFSRNGREMAGDGHREGNAVIRDTHVRLAFLSPFFLVPRMPPLCRSRLTFDANLNDTVRAYYR